VLSDDLDLVQVTVKLSRRNIERLDDLAQIKKIRRSSLIRQLLDASSLAELEREYGIDVIRIRRTEKELSEAEREVKLKKMKLEAQQVENRTSPHVFG